MELLQSVRARAVLGQDSKAGHGPAAGPDRVPASASEQGCSQPASCWVTGAVIAIWRRERLAPYEPRQVQRSSNPSGRSTASCGCCSVIPAPVER
jgi:hypothetical protein